MEDSYGCCNGNLAFTGHKDHSFSFRGSPSLMHVGILVKYNLALFDKYNVQLVEK